jgi:4-hydroxybenzoate polyprenyltransferase
LSLAGRIPLPAILLTATIAAAQALWHFTLIRDRSRDGCFRAFRVNHWFGFTLFAGTVAGYALAA